MLDLKVKWPLSIHLHTHQNIMIFNVPVSSNYMNCKSRSETQENTSDVLHISDIS